MSLEIDADGDAVDLMWDYEEILAPCEAYLPDGHRQPGHWAFAALLMASLGARRAAYGTHGWIEIVAELTGLARRLQCEGHPPQDPRTDTWRSSDRYLVDAAILKKNPYGV